MILLCAAALAGAPAEGTLDAAYQKEYAYLVAEKAELEARKAELERDAEARAKQADGELARAQARLVAATRQADAAEDSLDEIQRAALTGDDADALLRSTLQQAGETLGVTPASTPAEAVGQVFGAVADKLAAVNGREARDGSFFLPGGEEVQGRLYPLGQIGAWGVSERGSGSLAPAGEGRLQLRLDQGKATAAAMAAGGSPSTIELYLYEPERGAEEPEKAGGLVATIESAGTMGKVLFVLGMVSLVLTLSRALTLVFARRGGQSLVEGVVKRLREGQPEHALSALHGRGGPLVRVLQAIIRDASRPREELDRVVDESILRELPGIDRFASALTVITAGSPLLGLLGTVTGMIATFDVITEHGTGNPKLMSAGIAEALICTALGLSVAIPTLLAGNVLASVADGIKIRIERASLAVLNAIDEAQRERAGRTSDA